MGFNLLDPSTEARIVRAALTLEIFTLPQLARFARIKIRTLRTMFSRHRDHFEVHLAQLGNCRGAQSKVYQLTSVARDAYQEPSGPPQMPFKAEFISVLESAAAALAASAYALTRCRGFTVPADERSAQLQAAWSHCRAADQSLQLASLLASKGQRGLVAENRRRALLILKKLVALERDMN